MTDEAKFDEIRVLVAKLYCAAGCNCCRNVKEFDAASWKLAQLLGVPTYPDGSGPDWFTVKTVDAEYRKDIR